MTFCVHPLVLVAAPTREWVYSENHHSEDVKISGLTSVVLEQQCQGEMASAIFAGVPAGWTGGDAADSEDDGERSSGSSAFGSTAALGDHGSSRSGTPESSGGGGLRRGGGSGLWRKVFDMSHLSYLCRGC